MTNADDWIAGYQQAVARLLLEKGVFVDLNRYPRDDWTMDEPDETDYDESRVYYGWTGWAEWRTHAESGCRIDSWDYSSLRERSILQFMGTFTDAKNEVGMEMRASCVCGEYTDRWVRWEGTLSEALEIILKGE